MYLELYEVLYKNEFKQILSLTSTAYYLKTMLSLEQM